MPAYPTIGILMWSAHCIKNGPHICVNYHEISPLNIAYEVLSSGVCERLKHTINELIWYQVHKSTIKQIFTTSHILENSHAKRVNSHHLYIDFKATFECTVRSCHYDAMSELGIPAKLIWFITPRCAVWKDLYEPTGTKRVFMQGYTILCAAFNLILEEMGLLVNEDKLFEQTIGSLPVLLPCHSRQS